MIVGMLTTKTFPDTQLSFLSEIKFPCLSELPAKFTHKLFQFAWQVKLLFMDIVFLLIAELF